jgi:selenocysteine lyase/cysteine desulfurase
MSTVALDVAAVRARFSALDTPTAFLDGPGGTQVPDSVIEAMTTCLREANANLGGPFETSRRADAIVEDAHEAAARFLASSTEEVGFGQNMTTLNFALTRTLGRELGQRFLDGLPPPYRLYGVPSMEGRVPTFAVTHPDRSPEELAARLGERDIATWPGNYYAVEVMERLGLPDGTLRIGFVHYNTRDEVDRVLAALQDLA